MVMVLAQCQDYRMQGSWRTHGALWIAMEYCGGGSVADLVHAAEGPLTQPIIAYLCAETLSGLKYLHSIGKVPDPTPFLQTSPGFQSNCQYDMSTPYNKCCMVQKRQSRSS